MKMRILTAIPLILVNIVAVSGQYAFLREHMTWPVYGVAIFAAALESTALYLAYMAHESLIRNDSSLRLRLASYGFGLIAGIMNLSHYSPHGHITVVGIGTALMSVSSPWLWGVYSRRQSRNLLVSAGLIETHAVRLGFARVMWHPIRSTRVMYHATWNGIQSPAEAIALIEPGHEMLRISPVMPTLTDMLTQADTVRFAIRALASEGKAVTAPDVAAWLHDHASDLSDTTWNIPAGYVRDIMRRDSEAQAKQSRSMIRALPGKDTARSPATGSQN